MATPTQETNRAKFLELRTSGKSVADARNATYGPAPVAPDVVPTPVIPVPEAPLPYINTPDGTPLLQPAPAPAPVATPDMPVVQSQVPIPEPVVTPEIASSTSTKGTPPVDFNAGLGREQDIMNNLKAFSDKGIIGEDLKKASGYNTATPEKRAIIDAYTAAQTTQSNLPVDETSIMNLLRTNSPIPDNVRNSPSFNTAKQNFNKVRAFSTYSVNNLVGAMNNGSLLPGTKVYNELLNDPAMRQKLTQAQTYTTKKPVDISTVSQTTNADILANNPTIANYLADGIITPDEYNKATNNAEIVAKAKDVETKTNKYNELKAKYDAIEEDTKAEFASRPIPQSAIDSVIADRQKNMYKGLVLAKGVVDSALGTLTELKSEASTLFDTNLKLNATREATKTAKELAQYQEQLKTGDINSTDPFIKQKGIESAVEKIVGAIPTQRSKAQIVQDILASGDVTAALSKLNTDIQGKAEYKAEQLKKDNEGVTFQTIGDKVYKVKNGQLIDTGVSAVKSETPKSPVWKQDSKGNWYNENSVTRPDQQAGAGTKSTGNIIPVTAGNKTVRLDQIGATGFTTAIDALKAAGIPIVVGEGHRNQTDTIKSMADRYGIPFNANNPAETAQKLRKAGHQVADPGKSNHESGMAIDVYGSSNLDAVSPEQEKILNANGWYSANIPGDAGHFEYRGSPGKTETISPEAKSYVDVYNAGTMDLETILTKLGTSKEATPLKNEIITAVASQGGKPMRTETDPAVASLQRRKADIQFLKDDPYMDTVVGTNALGRTSLSNFLSGGKDEYLSKVKQFFASDVLQSLIDAKAKGATFGALSDAELAQLKNASNSLAGRAIYEGDNIVGFKGSEESFKEELEKLANDTQKAIDRMTGVGSGPVLSNTAPITGDQIVGQWTPKKVTK